MKSGSKNHLETTPLLNDSPDVHDAGSRFLSARSVLTFLGFLGFVNVYALRVNLSVALVAMVNSTGHAVTNSTEGECGSGQEQTTSHSGEFNWDEKTQGLVLGAFFYGYVATQFIGGFLAERFGGKWLLGLGVFITSVLTLLTPVAARTSAYLFVAVRIIEGLAEGVTFPAMHAMLSHWAPPLERSKMATIVYSGAHFGTVLALPLSGLMSVYGFDGGWPTVFYVFGTFGCLWFVFWVFFVFDSPKQHPRISPEERQYIENATRSTKNVVKPPLPWCSVLKSVPFWAIFIAHFCNNWGFYTLLTCLPTYLATILKFDISKNGLLSSLPYLVLSVTSVCTGQLADRLRQKKILSTKTVRKLALCTGLIVPAGLLIALGYVGCDRTLAIGLLIGAVGFNGLVNAGHFVNHLDIAPPFAGTLLGITNTAGSVPGIVAPQMVGALTFNNQTVQAWQLIFGIAAAVNSVGCIAFFLMAEGEEQDWSKAAFSKMQRERDSSRKSADFNDL